MIRVLSSISAVFVSLALLVAGGGLLGSLLGLRMRLEGFESPVIGGVLAAYSVGFVLGTRFSAGLIRQVGQIRAFAAFAALAAVSVLLHPLWVGPAVWAALRAVTGFSVAAVTLVAESWVNGVASIENRGVLLGVYTAVFYLASASGQLLLNLGTPASFELFSLVGILFVLSLTPLALTRALPPNVPSVSQLGLRDLARISPLALAGAILAGAAISAFLFLGPLLADSYGLGVGGVARYMAVAVLAAMILQWPAGHLSDRFPRSRVIALMAAVAAIACLLNVLLGNRPPWSLYVTTAVFMGFASSLYPLSLSLLSDLIPNEEVVPASATMLFAYGLGSIAGPLAAGAMMAGLGPGGLLGFNGLCMLFLAAYALHRGRLIAPLPVEDQAPYVTVTPSATPVLSELDPRLPVTEFDAHHPTVGTGSSETGEDKQGLADDGGRGLS